MRSGGCLRILITSPIPSKTNWSRTSIMLPNISLEMLSRICISRSSSTCLVLDKHRSRMATVLNHPRQQRPRGALRQDRSMYR